MTAQKSTLRPKVSRIAVFLLAGVATPLWAMESTTDLELVVAPVPWGETFQLGAGIDAVTGSVAGTAIKPFTTSSATVKSSHEAVSYISNEAQLRREIEASISGKYNIEPSIAIKASASYLNKLEVSQNSTTVVAKYVSSTDYNEANRYELTDQVSALKKDPKAFRQTYGDYFVAGVKKGSQFIAVYNMRSSSKQQLDKFKSEIGGEGADLFKADVSGKFENKASEANISYEINVFMDGYRGAYEMQNKRKWTPKEVLRALDWFKTNEVGKPLMAKLKHYSTVDPSYPRAIDIDPEVFNDLRRLYTTLWEVRALSAALPEYNKQQLRDALSNFDSSVVTKREVLATNLQLRMGLTTQGAQLLSNLQRITARRAFFEEVRSCQKNEPGWHDGGMCVQECHQDWDYGYTPNNLYMVRIAEAVPGAVDIKNEKRGFQHDWEIAKTQRGMLEINDPNKLIVGWKVTPVWTDKNGGWYKETNGPILLSTRGAIGVQSLEWRGTNWEVTFYYVNPSDYRFH